MNKAHKVKAHSRKGRKVRAHVRKLGKAFKPKSGTEYREIWSAEHKKRIKKFNDKAVEATIL